MSQTEKFLNDNCQRMYSENIFLYDFIMLNLVLLNIIKVSVIFILISNKVYEN